MLSSNFRPWGELNWLIDKLQKRKWLYLGCISTEDRCITAYEIMLQKGLVDKGFFVEIIDPPSGSDAIVKSKIRANKKKLSTWGQNIQIEQIDLLCKDFEIVDLATEITKTKPENVLLDISSFPKRFFFPLIKLLLQNPSIATIIVTYTQPVSYSLDDLSDDPEPWYPLPLFMSTDFPEPKYDLAFVGTGFMPFSLPKLLKDNHSEISLRLFFPFPPGPPNFNRSWEFIRKIEKYYTFKDNDKIPRVDALDLNGTFDYIKSATDSGNKKCLFAPYGPKPISLAMCLYAIAYNSPVFYTQPKFYNADYSIGSKESIGYCIKLQTRNLF